MKGEINLLIKTTGDNELLLLGYEKCDDLVWDKDHPKIVLWSGGADSTLLMLELATMCKVNNMPLHTLSVDIGYIQRTKHELEDKARKKILDILKEKGFDIKNSWVDVNQELEYFNPMHTQICLPQQFLWTMVGLQLVPKNSDIFFGYIKGDDFWMMMDKTEQILKISNDWLHLNTKFHYPYQCQPKSAIYERLHRVNMLQYIWTCEQPDEFGEPCEICAPCRHRRDALFELAMLGAEWAKELLEKENHIVLDWANYSKKEEKLICQQ